MSAYADLMKYLLERSLWLQKDDVGDFSLLYDKKIEADVTRTESQSVLCLLGSVLIWSLN